MKHYILLAPSISGLETPPTRIYFKNCPNFSISGENSNFSMPKQSKNAKGEYHETV